MKTLPILLLCALCVLSNIPGMWAQLIVCVDPHEGNDATCTRDNSCTGQPCKTLGKSAMIADHEGTIVNVTAAGSFNDESVQITAKAIQFHAHVPDGNHFTGGFHWSGDCTGYSSVRGFTIQFDGVNSPIDMGLARYTTLDLDINIEIPVPLTGQGYIGMIDLEHTDKLTGAANKWNVNFTSTNATQNMKMVVFTRPTNDISPAAQNDLVLHATVDALTPASAEFTGYNAQVVFKSSATPVAPIGKNFFNIGSSNGFSVSLEAFWADLELGIIQCTNVDVTVLQGIDTFMVTKSANIKLFDTTQPKFEQMHISNVNGFKGGNIQDTPIILDGDFNASSSGLSNIRFNNLVGCTISVTKSDQPEQPTVHNFDIYITNSTFAGGPTNYPIINPYNIAIVAQNNWWGIASGPNTTCNNQGQGPSLDDHNIDYSKWCLDSTCSKLSDSKCGTPNVPVPPIPTPVGPDTPQGPSPGAVAGIVLGVLAVIIVIAVGVWYFKFRRSDYSSLG